MRRQSTDDTSLPALADRRTVARRLYERAALLLLAAEGYGADDEATAGRFPPAVLRATAAQLQALAARLEAQTPVPAPVPVVVSQPRRWRLA